MPVMYDWLKPAALENPPPRLGVGLVCMLLAAVGSMPLWQKAAMGFGDYRTAPLFGKRCTSRNADL